MKMRLSLGKDLRHSESFPSFVCLCQPICSAFIGGIRQLVVQITRMDANLMGCLMAGQVRNMMSSLKYKIKFNMGGGSLVGPQEHLTWHNET